MKKIKEEFKVIQEFSTYYLCISNLGYKECFNKTQFKPDAKGIIIKISDGNGNF